MADDDLEILKLRKRLEELQRNKRQKAKTKRRATGRRRGRPRIDREKLQRAHDLALTFPIPDVALVTGISTTTLDRYGIKRYRLNAEAAAAAK